MQCLLPKFNHAIEFATMNHDGADFHAVSGLRLFQQLGIKPLIDFLLMRRITIRLKSSDEIAAAGASE